MPSLNIEELVNFNRFDEFTRKLNEADRFSGPEMTFFDTVKSAFNGHNPVTDRVFEIISGRVRWILKSEDQSFDSPSSVKLVAKTVLSECGVSYRELNNIESVKKVFEKLAQPDFFHAISNRDKFDISTSEGRSTKANAENIIKVLMGAPFSSIDFTSELLKGVLWNQNRELLEGFLECLQQKIVEASKELQKENLPQNEEIMLVAALGNLLSLIPFAEPDPGFILTVPQRIVGKWTDVKYRSETLLLTPKKYGSQVPAIGLKPVENNEAAPLLLFRGTPQPSASGAIPATFSDTIPFYSVGEYIYENYSKELIQDWVNKCEKKVKLYGQSLGGSLSLITLVNQPEKISEVFVYGSPSLLKSTMKNYESNLRKCSGDVPRVHIYWNHRDIVPLTGHGFHKNWNLHKVIIPNLENLLSIHALMHTAYKNVVIVNIDPELDSKTTSRKVMVVFHLILSCLLLPFIFLTIQLMALCVYIRRKVSSAQELFNESNYSLTNMGDATLVQPKSNV